MLMCLAFAPLPQLCPGDGAGQACTAASCTCLTACTCKSAHHAAQELAEKLGHGDACQSHAERLAACEAMLAACHGDDAPTHFAPGTDLGPALIAPYVEARFGRSPAARLRRPDARLAAMPPPPRGRPPWLPA